VPAEALAAGRGGVAVVSRIRGYPADQSTDRRIETTSHHSRDVTFGEDRSRIRFNPGVFARLRSFGFNILKANRTSTLSQDRYRAGLAGFERLAQLVNI